MRSIYKYIPHEKITLETKLSKEKILNRLFENTTENDAIDWVWLRRRTNSDRYFGGIIYESGFKLSPNLSYRNSSVPKIEGTIESSKLGSTVEVSLKLHGFIGVLTLLWVFTSLLMTIVGLFHFLNSEENATLVEIIAPLCMLIFGYLLFYLGFKYESIKARKLLIALLSAKEVNH